MSNQLESNQTTKGTFRCNKSLLEEYDEQIGDKSRSEAIRQHMREVVGQPADGVQLPEESLLRDGFEAIRQSAGPDGTIPTSTAKSRVAESTRVKQSDALRTVIKPLSNRGYVSVGDWGVLRINVGRYD